MDMNTVTTTLKTRLLVALSGFCFSLGISAATLDIEQKPLLVNEPLPPNIMFILDDSGSMAWDHMPEGISCDNDMYSSGRINRTDRERCESYQYNEIYYNPNAEYLVPVDGNGNSLGDASFENAWEDGFDSDRDDDRLNLYQWVAAGSSQAAGAPAAMWEFDYSRRREVGIYCGNFSGGVCTNLEVDSIDSGNGDWRDWLESDYTFEYLYKPDDRGLYCRDSTSNCDFDRIETDTVNGGSYWRWWLVIGERNPVLADGWMPFRYFEYDENASGCNGTYTDDDCYVVRYVPADPSDPSLPASETAHLSDPYNVHHMQNVANWYAYYRDRMSIAKSGISLAFDSLDPSYRLGYGRINLWSMIESDVRKFEDSRSSFYTWLHGENASGNTPLPRALYRAGEYFSSEHPYRINTENASEGYLSCRQNFAILMTDGYWNQWGVSGDASGDHDDLEGDTITGPGGLSYKYTPVAPFEHDGINLADVAMYYWKNDLRDESDDSSKNDVPTSSKDPAFWQHMVTMGIGLGVTGTVSKEEAFNAIDAQTVIDWDAGTTNEDRIDDLLHAAVNSRGNFFSAQNPAQFISGLEASLAEIASRVGSGSALAASSSQLLSGTTLYNASYRSGDWSGNLSAYTLDASSGDVSGLSWNASIPSYLSRSIYTVKEVVKGNKTSLEGVLVSNASDLDSDMQAALTSGYPGSASAQDLLEYLRGNQAGEQQSSGDFRDRANGLLGDIVHSSPVYVGAPDASRYKYTGWSEADSHATFAATHASRSEMVYVNANDGIMHGFLADSSASNKGQETYAYMPRAVLLNGVSALADPDYNHEYYLDGPLVAQDVYINNNWRTVLVGTTGRAGENANNQTGKAIFAIDVTDPSSMDEDSVLWEISHDDIGQVTSPPVIARLDDGDWYAIFGNGYNSTNDRAALIRVKLEDGSMTVIPGTSTSQPNGLAGPLVWDLDEDGSADTAYAGDLYGNVYKFDLINTSATPEIIYVAKDGNGQRQPITAGITGHEDDKGDTWIYFGTGKYFSIADMSNRDEQTWYGLKAEEISASSTRSDLRQRTISTGQSLGDYTARTVSAATDGDMLGRQGWYIDFDASDAPGERMVLPSQIRGDAVIGYTTIPIADACNPGGDGYVMAVNPFTGGRLERIYFDFTADGEFNSNDQLNGTSPSGLSVGRIPSAGVFVDDDLHFNTDSAVSEKIATNPGSGAGAAERISWKEITE